MNTHTYIILYVTISRYLACLEMCHTRAGGYLVNISDYNFTCVKYKLTTINLTKFRLFKYVPQDQNPNAPVMSKVVSLTIDPLDEYPLHPFFDEEHFPSLKKLRLHNLLGRSIHLDVFKRHRGVEYLSVELSQAIIEVDFAAKMVSLFPSVKKFDLSIDPLFTRNHVTTMTHDDFN